MATPPSTAAHVPPSLPTSPLAKRPRTDVQNGTMASSADATTKTPEQAPPPPLSSAPPLLIKKLAPTARAPTRGSAYAAGYDLYAAKSGKIPARGKGLVDTELAIAVGEGCCSSPISHRLSPITSSKISADNNGIKDGRIAPRSGLAAKHMIDTGAGVIDADYRGQVKVLLFNHADTDFEVEEGDRVAQFILERIYTPEVKVVEELEESVRGVGGFGSTG